MKTLSEILRTVNAPSLDVNIGEVTVPTADVRLYWQTNYGCYHIANCADSTEFLNLWRLWRGWNVNNLKQLLKAYDVEYNPLTNVDFEEITTDEHGEQTKTSTIADRVNTIGQSTIHLNVDGVENTQENSTYPFNTTTAESTDKAIQTLGEIKNVNDEQINTSGGGVDTEVMEEYTDKRTYTKKGNDGSTMTTQKLIDEELRVRGYKHVVFSWLDGFIKEYGWFTE